MYVCIFDPGGGGVPCEMGGNARRKIRIKAILKQTVNARRRASMHLSHGSAPPGEFMWHYVAPIRLRLLSSEYILPKKELVRIRLLKLKVRQG